MAACDFCGTNILFGAIKRGDLQFCGAKCAANAPQLESSLKVPEADLERQVREIHQGNCPKCGGPGPVDVYTSHRVYSALAFTSWSSHPAICCRPCGRKKQLGHAVFSMCLGWWGFPYGLIITPVQVARNLGGLIGIGQPDGSEPSAGLRRAVRLSMAGRPIAPQ